MDWCALNDGTDRGANADEAHAAAARTAEAEESRLAASYESALRAAASGDRATAIDALRHVLGHALTNDADNMSAGLARVKFLALKNLGRFLEDDAASAKRDDSEALRCYAAAVELDDEDVMLWRRLGGAAAARGELSVARLAYERGIALRPKNQLLLEDLSEVCLAAGDLDAARGLAREILKHDSTNIRARTMAESPENLDLSVAMRDARDVRAANAHVDQDDEIAIRFAPSIEKSWATLAGVLSRLGGVLSPEMEMEKTPGDGGVNGADVTGVTTPVKTTESAATPSQTPVPTPNNLETPTNDGTSEFVNLSFLRAVEGVDVPVGVPLGKSLRFIFDSESEERQPETVSMVDGDEIALAPQDGAVNAPATESEVINFAADESKDPNAAQTPPPASQSEVVAFSQGGDTATKGKRQRRTSVEGPVRKSRRQEEMDAKKAIEDEKERIIAEQKAAMKAAEAAERQRLLDEKKWAPEQQIARTLLKMIGIDYEDPTLVLAKAMNEKAANDEEHAQDVKKKHLREMKEAAAKKAEEERRLKIIERVAAFASTVDGSNGGVAHVAWRFLSTTAARWRPDTEDDCAPSPSMLFTLVQIYGVGPGDELAPISRILLCLADAAVLAARACSLEQPERHILKSVAQGFLDQAATEMTKDITQDFQAESLFLRHKVAELSGEESSVISFYLDQAQECAPDDAEVPPPSAAIVDAAPARFTKQLLRAAMDSMKVKEVVTGAASRFSKGQTSELVSTLTPLLLADEDEELTDALTLTQSERQEALKVLAMAAREEGSACVVVELKALKCLYDLTKDSRNLRNMAEAIDASKRVHTKRALDIVEQLGIQTIAASLFELHYSELAREPGMKKNLNKSRVASANMEAAALVLSSIQRASKGTVVDVIELHEKLHDKLADCRCCCGDGRKGAFLKSSLVHLARHRNRVTAAREARQIAEESTAGKKRGGQAKTASAQLQAKGNGKSTHSTDVDNDDEGAGRRRVRRQRVSSIETADRTPQDKADRKILERLDKLIVQFCYCVYGFELERPKRRCREEGGATEAMLAISSEQNAADLWLSLQPYAMQSKDQQRETIVAIMQAIRSHVKDPPQTKQGVAVDSYLTEFSDYLTTDLSIDEVVAKERALARSLIVRLTPDEALNELRLPGTPAKTDKSTVLPNSPKASVVHVSDRDGPSASDVEDKITRYGEVYKTLYQFCVEVDGPALETALEVEQADAQEISALLKSCMPSGVTPSDRKSVADTEVANDGLVASMSADFMRMLKFDVQYNLKRPQSWIALADHMDTIKDIVLSDSAKIMTVSSFRASSMMELIEKYQVAIRRALLAADEALSMSYHDGHAETEWIRSQIHERLGQASYEFLQNAPPMYDGRLNTLNTNDPSFKAALLLCTSAYTRAAQSNPDEWSYPYHLAKLAKKSGQPLPHVLSMHAGALALLPGSLEALYQVTNIRLRILMSIDVPGRKKMTPEDQALTIAVLKQPFLAGQMQNSWIGGFRDCIEALLFISKNYPKFHKASFRLAWARLKKSPGEIGHIRKALDYLEPLFTVPKTGTFKQTMLEIDDSNLGIDNSGKETQLNEDGTLDIVYEAGVNEPRRRFIANVRRALQLYIALQYTNENIASLWNAVVYLSDFKASAKSRLSIVSSARDIRMYTVGLMLRAMCQTFAQPKLSDDLVTQRGEKVPPHKRETFLEYAYNTWFEFAITARANVASWEANVNEAFEQIAGEELRTDSGPDLIKEPYQTAFFNASEINSSTDALFDFEKFALEHVANLEAKTDISTLAAQFSLCTSRLTECKANDAHVLEQGRARLRTLQNANKAAFMRCSETMLTALAKAEIDLTADIDIDTDGKDKSAEEDPETDAARLQQEKSLADGETVLITAQRMHRNTKQESVTRVNEYQVNRKNILTAYTNAVKHGRPLASTNYDEGTDLHRVYCELLKSTEQCDHLGQKHRELVEAALANESQTTNPEQLKLIKGAYDDVNAANENHSKILATWETTCAAHREETASNAAAMSKSDIETADTTAYVLRVASAVSKSQVTSLTAAERIVDAAVNDVRKIRAKVKKAIALREKSKKTKKSTAAAVEEAAAVEDVSEMPDPNTTTDAAEDATDVQMLDV